MGLSVSSPYAVGSIGAISFDMTTIDLVGVTPTADWVGRCIRLSSGVEGTIGNIFKIASVLLNSVTLSHPMNVSPFDSIGVHNIVPVVGDEIVVSYSLDDLADGVNIIEVDPYCYTMALTSSQRVTIANKVFIYDTEKTIRFNSMYIASKDSLVSDRACWMFGDIDENGNTYNPCTLINTLATTSQGWNQSSGVHCDWHMYGGSYIVSLADSTMFDYIFDSDPVVRFYNVFLNGNYGGRLGMGTRSIFGNVTLYGSSSEFSTFNPANQGGKVFNIEVQKTKQLMYHYWLLSKSQFIRGIKFDSEVQRLVWLNQTTGGAATGFTLELNNLDMVKVKALPNALGTNGYQGGTTNFFKLSNNVVINSFDADSRIITEPSKMVLKNNVDDTVIFEETTEGTLPSTLVNYATSTVSFTGFRPYSELPSLVEAGPFKVGIVSYNYVPGVRDTSLDQSEVINFTSLTDTNITETDQSAVDAYTEISNLDELYDAGKSFFYKVFQDLEGISSQPLTIENEALDCGDFDITIGDFADALAIGEAGIQINSTQINNGVRVKSLKTAGTITGRDRLAIDRITDFNGTAISISVTNVVPGSRVQIVNVTDGVELSNEISNSSTYNLSLSYPGDKDIRVRVGHIDYLGFETFGKMTINGMASIANMEFDQIYADNGIDGTTVVEFTPDFPNVEVDVNDADNKTSPQRFYAWAKSFQTTEQGIAGFFKGIAAEDSFNYRVRNDINMKLDNTKSEPLIVTGGRVYRADGETIISATSNSVQIEPDKAYVANSAGIATKLDEVPDRVWEYEKL